MKVFRCTASNTVAGETHNLCWDDILSGEDGVYEAKGRDDMRLIVISTFGENRVVLYYSKDGELQTANQSWSYHRFRKTDERVCFEVRPK